MSYTLTIFDTRRQVIQKVETFEPPDEATINEIVKATGVPGAWCDVSRKDLEAEDFEYRNEP